MRALALLLLLGPSLASAQLSLTPALELSLSQGFVTVDAGNETSIQATVRNTGTLAGVASITLLDMGGWSATAEPSSSIRLEPGSGAIIDVTLTAPAAGDGASQRTILVEAVLMDDTGRQAVAQQPLSATRIDPPLPAPVPWWATRDAVVSYVLGALALTAVAWLAALALRRRRAQAAAAARAAYLDRETGIGIAVDSGPHRFGAGREIVYRVRVWNESDRPRVAIIAAADLPPGWRATPSLPRMALSAGEAIAVTFLVAPAQNAPTGMRASIAFLARPEEARELDVRSLVDVVAPDVRIPTPGESIPVVVAHRGGEMQARPPRG